jgi:hypothetical protein
VFLKRSRVLVFSKMAYHYLYSDQIFFNFIVHYIRNIILSQNTRKNSKDKIFFV